MPSLHLRGVSFAHSTAATILTDVDLDLDVADPAWVGVVGPNGAGKTTLLRLVAGELVPTVGRLDVEADLSPLLVPQSVETLTDDVRTFAWTWDGVAQRLRSRLALEPDDPDGLEGRWLTLSPGQRKRWQLAAALAQDPDVLLLDEPTNHLDVDARALVAEALAGFRGLGLIVSHDRTVLDRLTGRTLRLHRGGVDLHAGAYSDASARWRVEEAALRAEHDRARRELRRQRRILADVRRDRHGAEAGPCRERRLAGASDPDAREAGRKLAQAKAEAALAQRVAQMRSRVERAEADLDELDVRRERGGDVAFRPARSGRRIVARVVGDVAHAGGETWLTDVDLALHRGQRVHLTGRNGAGKTTLLRAFGAEVATTDEVLAELPQELDDPRRELDRVRRLLHDLVRRGRARARRGRGAEPVLIRLPSKWASDPPVDQVDSFQDVDGATCLVSGVGEDHPATLVRAGVVRGPRVDGRSIARKRSLRRRSRRRDGAACGGAGAHRAWPSASAAEDPG